MDRTGCRTCGAQGKRKMQGPCWKLFTISRQWQRSIKRSVGPISELNACWLCRPHRQRAGRPWASGTLVLLQLFCGGCFHHPSMGYLPPLLKGRDNGQEPHRLTLLCWARSPSFAGSGEAAERGLATWESTNGPFRVSWPWSIPQSKMLI